MFKMPAKTINFVEDNVLEDDNDCLDSEIKDPAANESDEDEIKQDLEPPTKRVKRDLAKEAEAELSKFNEMIENSNILLSDKLENLSDYLSYIVDNNVNTLQFEEDFNEWTKQKALVLLSETSETSEEFYKFLCSILKATPTIIEGLCDKIFTIIYKCQNSDNDEALEFFITKLSDTFEKLHRYPKLIAKLLCSVRENIPFIVKRTSSTSSKSKTKKKETFKPIKDVVEFILPQGFMKSFCSALNVLPVGQIIDLWKMIDHNLAEECVKKINQPQQTEDLCLVPFLYTIVSLLESFLFNIKVADYSVSSTTVERVGEMMTKLRDVSLTELGKAVISNKTNYLQPFLKLSSAWGTLQVFMFLYNQKYAGSFSHPGKHFQKAEDLSFLFSYLTGEEWISLTNLVEESKDLDNSRFLVNLVALKLKCLAVIDQQRQQTAIEKSSLPIEQHDTNGLATQVKQEPLEKYDEPDVTSDNLKLSVKDAALFIWTRQHLYKSNTNRDAEDILDLASSYVDSEYLLQYAKMYLAKRIALPKEVQSLHSIRSVKFQVALILESLDGGLNSVENILKQPSHKFRSEILSSEFKTKFLQELDYAAEKPLSDEMKNHIQHALEIVKDAVATKMECTSTDPKNYAQMVQFLDGSIQFLDQRGLCRYPKSIKTIIFLGSSIIFTAVLGNVKNAKIITTLISILSNCGQHSRGTELLFQFNWMGLYDLLNKHFQCLSQNDCERLCALILENIYVSPRTANEFSETNMRKICEDFDLIKESEKGGLSVSVLEFIVEEATERKSKSTTLLTSQMKQLANVAVSKLSDGSIIKDLHSLNYGMKTLKKKGTSKESSSSSPTKSKAKMTNSSSFPFVSRVMQTCYLLLKGKSLMSVEDVSEYNVIVLPYLHFALDFLEVGKTNGRQTGGYYEKNMLLVDDDEMLAVALFKCQQFLIESLSTFDEFRAKLAQDFLPRLWDCCAVEAHVTSCSDSNKETRTTLNANIARRERCKKPKKGILKLILEVANDDEFQTICDTIAHRVEKEEQLPVLAYALSNLIDSEIKGDGDTKKKQIRRTTVEQSLYKCLEHFHLWKESTDFVNSILPYVHFQSSLLRRRKRMCDGNALAVSLSTVTAIPFDKIKDVETFKSIFLSVGELLNALALHRIDVLSFRTHIFLQCFQSLVEGLVKRADQRNKLSDREIYDLRQCGHCIERICQSTKAGKQEFFRTSPYLIVVLLQQFEKITVYPIVKNPLLSGCYKLLDMCDENGISHVNSMLSQGSREIFKAVYDVYKKFYRYKGKV